MPETKRDVKEAIGTIWHVRNSTRDDEVEIEIYEHVLSRPIGEQAWIAGKLVVAATDELLSVGESLIDELEAARAPQDGEA